jgi:hypothetical protein
VTTISTTNARRNHPAAASDAKVRTWFERVHAVANADHAWLASTMLVSTLASVSFERDATESGNHLGNVLGGELSAKIHIGETLGGSASADHLTG